MDVQVLPDGPVLRISQDLGPSARGCRLDPTALETAVGLVAASLAGGADVLIINKFGKHEAEGRGFRAVIAEALALGIPVIVGVNGLNLASFEEFAGGLASRLPPDCETLAAWASRAIAPAIEAA
jgi:glycosyltransferase involved in cell wall biosynthesis